jgi:hypothetical protein
MVGNVSEWLKESYSNNWRSLFSARQEHLDNIPGNDVVIVKLLERHFDKYNSKNGKLVKEANWCDSRSSSIQGKNSKGINAKVFIDPKNSHSTIGFRYVINVNRIEN